MSNSVKLSHACGATQDGRVMVERSDRMSKCPHLTRQGDSGQEAYLIASLGEMGVPTRALPTALVGGNTSPPGRTGPLNGILPEGMLSLQGSAAAQSQGRASPRIL